MDLQTLTYTVVGATFVLYVGIAVWARAGTTKEFYVAGGGIHPISNGMATAADEVLGNMTAALQRKVHF